MGRERVSRELASFEKYEVQLERQLNFSEVSRTNAQQQKIAQSKFQSHPSQNENKPWESYKARFFPWSSKETKLFEQLLREEYYNHDDHHVLPPAFWTRCGGILNRNEWDV